MNAPLPSFMRLPTSSERDSSNSNQRLQNSDDANHTPSGNQQNTTSASDYLIPLPGPNGNNLSNQVDHDRSPGDTSES